MKNIHPAILKTVGTIITVLAAMLVPLVLLFLGIRILASSAFLEVEYRLPHFPPDEYGFTLEQRLEYSKVCIQYLNSTADISLLEALTFPDGAPLFNERELSHMEDVKIVYMQITSVGFGLTLVVAGLMLTVSRGRLRGTMLAGLRIGGLLSFGLVAGVGIFALLSFWTFFESFHGVFFQGDTWRFLYSDSLIRLFPMQFWQDVVLFLLVFTGGLGLLLGLVLRPKRKPNAG